MNLALNIILSLIISYQLVACIQSYLLTKYTPLQISSTEYELEYDVIASCVYGILGIIIIIVGSIAISYH